MFDWQEPSPSCPSVGIDLEKRSHLGTLGLGVLGRKYASYLTRAPTGKTKTKTTSRSSLRAPASRAPNRILPNDRLKFVAWSKVIIRDGCGKYNGKLRGAPGIVQRDTQEANLECWRDKTIEMAAQESFTSSSMVLVLKTEMRCTDDVQLARAGLFYNPTLSNPDNTTCYLCKSNLDGWEQDDSAYEEHLKLSPNCGWAVTIAIEQEIEGGSHALEDPMSERILEARHMTFGSKWPHENKKGWACKIQKASTQFRLLGTAFTHQLCR